MNEFIYTIVEAIKIYIYITFLFDMKKNNTIITKQTEKNSYAESNRKSALSIRFHRIISRSVHSKPLTSENVRRHFNEI
jgi:hypothetical protein